ncbi:MAG: hypothetical protein AAFY88_17935, partial [Acidobacteriota bacterium]
ILKRIYSIDESKIRNELTLAMAGELELAGDFLRTHNFSSQLDPTRPVPTADLVWHHISRNIINWIEANGKNISHSKDRTTARNFLEHYYQKSSRPNFFAFN